MGRDRSAASLGNWSDVGVLGGEAVGAGVEDQRLAAGGLVGLDLAEEHHVVPGVDLLRLAADEVRHDSLQHRRLYAGGGWCLAEDDPLELLRTRGRELTRQV